MNAMDRESISIINSNQFNYVWGPGRTGKSMMLAKMLESTEKQQLLETKKYGNYRMTVIYIVI